MCCPVCRRDYGAAVEICPRDGAELYQRSLVARIGTELNNYRIDAILGSGGMGAVYRGEHVMLNKPVAIKFLHANFARREGAANHFLREARAASRIRHPNIVDVTDFGRAADGAYYFVMEYLEGESLDDRIAREGRMLQFDAVNVVYQAARALAAASDEGVVQLDLKPENIYLIDREGRRRTVRRTARDGRDHFVVEAEGKFDFVKLLDFGVATFGKDELGPGIKARAGRVIGTPQYMAPERACGKPGCVRSTIYSLGVIFYEMLLGVLPFDDDDPTTVLKAHVSAPVPSPQDHDPSLAIDDATNATIIRCLHKDPADRFQSMDELAAELRRCFGDRVFLRDAHLMPGASAALDGLDDPRQD